jgi:hypothetical protein
MRLPSENNLNVRMRIHDSSSFLCFQLGEKKMLMRLLIVLILFTMIIGFAYRYLFHLEMYRRYRLNNHPLSDRGNLDEVYHTGEPPGRFAGRNGGTRSTEPATTSTTKTNKTTARTTTTITPATSTIKPTNTVTTPLLATKKDMKRSLPLEWGPEIGMEVKRNHSNIITNASTICQTADEKVFLLIMYLTHAWYPNRRTFIRKTVGSVKRHRGHVIRHVFLFGDSSWMWAPQHVTAIHQEIKQYSDIATFHFHDTYQNLSLKTSAGLNWVTKFCPSARYVLKTDDDVLVLTPRLVEFLENLDPKNESVLYSGDTRPPHPVERVTSSFYYVPYELYPYANRPFYNIGVGILMSQGVVSQFAENSRRVPLYPSEDVFVGLLAKSIGIKPTCNRAIQWGYKPYKGSGVKERYCYYYDVMVIGFEKRYEEEYGGVWENYMNVTTSGVNVTCSLDSRKRRYGSCRSYPELGVNVLGIRSTEM